MDWVRNTFLHLHVHLQGAHFAPVVANCNCIGLCKRHVKFPEERFCNVHLAVNAHSSGHRLTCPGFTLSHQLPLLLPCVDSYSQGFLSCPSFFLRLTAPPAALAASPAVLPASLRWSLPQQLSLLLFWADSNLLSCPSCFHGLPASAAELVASPYTSTPSPSSPPASGSSV